MPTLSKDNINKRITVDSNGCWIWAGAVKKNPGRSLSYGWITFRGSQMNAHRASWIVHNGEVSDGLFVCHKCDIPRCVNPDHLFLGTASENMKDMWNKGRHKTNTGDVIGSYSSKLNLDQVREIRDLLSIGIFQKEIAKKFSINQATVSLIKNGKLWSRYD